MVQFHSPTKLNGLEGVRLHELRCKQSVSGFTDGNIYTCYIQQTTDKRIMVYTSSGVATAYHMFESKNDVENHFDEI